MVTLPLYGKEQEVRYRSKVLMAHFLGGRLVRVVWCEFKSESGHWKKAHLLLRLFDVSYGFQYGTRRAGNHVDHS